MVSRSDRLPMITPTTGLLKSPAPCAEVVRSSGVCVPEQSAKFTFAERARRSYLAIRKCHPLCPTCHRSRPQLSPWLSTGHREYLQSP